MRILVVSNLFPPVVEGGYERECAGAVEHLRRSHEVLVLTGDRDRRAVQAEAGVERSLPILPVSPAGSLRAPLASLRAARVTEDAIAGFGPDLVYFWNGFGVPVSALAAIGRSGLPLALRVCEHWFGHVFATDQFARELRPAKRSLPRRAWAALVRPLDRHPMLGLAAIDPFPAAISWNSDFLRDRTEVPAEVRPLLEERIYPALPQGDRFADVERRPSAEPTIAFVGRVSEEKGIHVAIEALSLLRGEHRVPARLRVAGPVDHATRGAMEAQIADLGLGAAVESLDEVDAAALEGLYASAHAVIVPSLWEEPAGLVCVEAALARAPLVASRSGGIPELIREPGEALLFDRGDAAGAAAMLAETLLEPEAASERVERAFARGRELSFGPYAEATDGFLARTVEAFAAAGSASSG
jgi:glycosyltransferase involved in cell wall biosynthesis